MNRAELADFLRHRREALQPSDVGLPRGVRRRTAGLRREEVASLVGMSTDYYARLEQERGPQPSEQMIAALARGLRLTLDERDHLFRLAGHTAPRRTLRSEHVSPVLMRVLDRLDDSPAMVVSELGETLAQNRLGAALLGDHSGLAGFDRSAYWRWFTDPEERSHYPARDHDHQSHVQAAALRAAMSLDSTDGRAAEIVRRLLATSQEFAAIWAEHQVAFRFDDHKTLVHPELGEVEVDCHSLFPQDQSQVLLVLTATPGSESAQKLELLAVVGTQQFSR